MSHVMIFSDNSFTVIPTSTLALPLSSMIIEHFKPLFVDHDFNTESDIIHSWRSVNGRT